MSGSGIGRGRGWLNINKNQNSKPGVSGSTTNSANYDYNSTAVPVSGPKLNSKYTSILAKISTFDENDDGILLNQKLKLISEEFNKICQTPLDVQEAFENIHENSLHDCEFASKTIGVVSTASFHSVTFQGIKLRNLFIAQFQKDFENSKALQSSNPKAFRCTVKMLGDFFHKARLADGRPIKFLSSPMLKYIEMLLESNNELDLQLFTIQIFMNGNAIKEELPEKLSETLIQVRKLLANSDRLSPTSKLWLLMALDISNNRYGLLPTEVHQFYISQLGDEAMSHIKKLSTELSIQTSYKNMKLDSIQSNVNVLQQVNNTQTINWDSGKAGVTEEKIAEAQQKFNKPQNFSSAEAGFNNIGTWEQPKQEKTPRPILGVGARLQKQNDRGSEDNNWRDRKSDTEWDESGWDSKQKSGGTNWNNGGNKPRKNVAKGWEHDDRVENDYN